MYYNLSSIAKKTAGIRVHFFRRIDSTNEHAKRMIFHGDRLPALIIAKKQFGGRGRMGRSFFSRGGGIYMSLVYKTDNSLSNTVSITTAAAVAVAQALDVACEKQFSIKWVNDIYLDQKKVCGILAESVSGIDHQSYVIVGIGINVGKCKFPKEIRDIAGWVDVKTSREELIADIISRLMSYIQNPTDRSYMSYYRERSMLCGLRVSTLSDGSELIGRVVDIDDDGGLILELDDGDKIRIFSGEVSVRQAQKN